MTTRDDRAGRPVRLKDVGERARVDPSLVSRVLNGDTKISIPDATRERILLAANELGYKPNHAARALVTSRSSTLALLVPQVSNPVYSPVIAGAQRHAFELGQVIVVGELTSALGAAGDQAELTTTTLDQHRVDGRMLASGTIDDRAVRALIADAPRTVVVNRRVRGAPCSVVVDDAAGSALAADHLLDLGHRRIAVMSGPRNIETSKRRIQGFTKALDRRGVQVAAEIDATGWTAEHGYEAGLEYLPRRGRITAIFGCTVMLAVGLLRAANELSISVPDELSIVALHDCEFAEFTWPPLTTVAMPMEELGAVAVEQLMSLIRGESVPGSIKVGSPPTLVERRSTAEVR